MTASPIAVTDVGGVRTIVLDRPEALNAVNFDFMVGVERALREGAEDPAVRCVAIVGRGRAFTAGLDLNDDGHTVDERDAAYDRLIATLESFPKPLVAGVNGLAVGFGTTMLGHCDIALAVRAARFRVPFAPLGLAPEAGSTVRLPALLGEQAANYALFTGSWISAEQAERGGLVLRLVDDDSLEGEVGALCAEIAANPVDSLVTTKRLLLESRLPAARAARGREEREFARLSRGPDHAEAIAAFREKRPPAFASASVQA